MMNVYDAYPTKGIRETRITLQNVHDVHTLDHRVDMCVCVFECPSCSVLVSCCGVEDVECGSGERKSEMRR